MRELRVWSTARRRTPAFGLPLHDNDRYFFRAYVQASIEASIEAADRCLGT